MPKVIKEHDMNRTDTDNRWTWTWLLFVTFAFLLPGCSGKSSIPSEALTGVDARSARVFWSCDLNQWTDNVQPGSRLTLFEVTLPDGQTERRAILKLGRQQPTFYIGHLAHQLGNNVPIETIFLDVEGDRFMVGWIDTSVIGKLEFVDVERVEPNRANWMQALKASEVEKRVFILPIFASETTQWKQIARIAIKTAESLSRGAKNATESGSEWEQTFGPPVDISNLFISVPQKRKAYNA